MQADIYLRKRHISWPSNRFVESMKFIEANDIFLFTLFSYLLSSYKSNLVRDVSSRLRILESSLRSSFVILVFGEMKFWQSRKKWEVDSISRLQEHSGLIVSWKLCLNLCSLRWLKPTRSLVSSFIPYMSATLNTLFGIVLINLSKDFLNILYDSELRISKLNLFHSLIV